MNKKRLLIASLTSILVLGGCSKQGVIRQTVDGKEVLVSMTDLNIFAEDKFLELSSKQTGGSLTYVLVERMVISQEIEITKSMRDQADLYTRNFEDNLEYTKREKGKEAAESQRAEAEKILKSAGFINGISDLKDYFIYQEQRNEFSNRLALDNAKKLLDVDKTKARRARHVLVKIADFDNITEEEQTKLTAVKDAIAAGTDLGAIASEYSDDTGSKEAGGDLGVIDKNTKFVEPFLKAVLSLKVNTISEPIKTEYGYHFIEVTADTFDDLMRTENEAATVKFIIDNHPELIYNHVKEADVVYENETIKKQVLAYIEMMIKQGGSK